MMRRNALAVLALFLGLIPVSAAELSGLTGKYVEARNCDVWTGPCFANADFNLTGKNAVLAWRIDAGAMNDVNIEGLGVAAVLAANNTLGLDQTGPTKSILLVDRRANSLQREALIRFAQRQGGKLLANVVAVHDVEFSLDICECKGEVCADVTAGPARVRTRCLDQKHDKACGNESAYFPPLTGDVSARPAAVIEHRFRGTGLNQTWSDFDRRGAYVGSFATR